MGSLGAGLGLGPRSELITFSSVTVGFPGSSEGKECTSNPGDPGMIPGLGSHGSPLQCSCLGTPMDREAWTL